MITVLAGGTGSAKLVRGLAAVEDDLTVISNVGDNIWLHGLYVCPDIDTAVYALSGMLDEGRGWGVRGDSFSFLDQLKALGGEAWFSLGDRDLAMHIFRTEMLREGFRLSEITDSIRNKLRIRPKVVPATDDPLTTVIHTNSGKMHLQEFWVKRRARPAVRSVAFEGSGSALACTEALDAIEDSDATIIAPANPVSSIGTILAVKEISRALAAAREKVIAVSPIIGASAVSGPAVKYMRALGISNSPAGVANYYSEFAGSFVISPADHGSAEQIARLGINVSETDIIMSGRESEKRLARYLLRRMKV